jgi:integrase
MKLSRTTIPGLALPAGKSDVIFFDDEIAGFGLRIRAGGKKTWVVQFRFGTKQRRVTLGDVKKLDADKARAAARNRLAQVTLGNDPAKAKHEARARAAETLGAIADRYLAHKEPVLRPKTFKDTKRYLKQHWRPLHQLPIHEIKLRDVATSLGEIASDHGPISAARARVALSGFFTWAMREGLAEANLVIGTNKPAEPQSRDRVLTDVELREIWTACRDDDHGRIVRLLMLTGQRREEVGGLRSSELDLEHGLWKLPGARTKNRRPHIVPLVPAAVGILKSAPQRTRAEGDADYVFGEGRGGFSGWSKAKAGLDRRINEARAKAAEALGKRADKPKSIASWRLHDLRRTAATVMADKLDVEPHIIETLLNHASGHKSGVHGVYNRAIYEREVMAALALWADHLAAVVEGAAHNVVVPFKRA